MIRILVVEDDRAFAALLEDWLTGEQHEVTAVHKGSDAWNQLKDHKYDLIIMDWDLPDVKGIDLVSQFRDGGGITPVIMLTGHTAMDDKVDGLDAGANDYLTKPFQWKELSARIRAVLRTQGAEPPLIPLGQGNEEVLRAADLAGTALATRYELLEIIGAGASAMVLKARHPGLEKLVAVKTLFPGLFTQEQLEQFEREARAISDLRHDNIATVHDWGLT